MIARNLAHYSKSYEIPFISEVPKLISGSVTGSLNVFLISSALFTVPPPALSILRHVCKQMMQLGRIGRCHTPKFTLAVFRVGKMSGGAFGILSGVMHVVQKQSGVDR